MGTAIKMKPLPALNMFQYVFAFEKENHFYIFSFFFVRRGGEVGKLWGLQRAEQEPFLEDFHAVVFSVHFRIALLQTMAREFIAAYCMTCTLAYHHRVMYHEFDVGQLCRVHFLMESYQSFPQITFPQRPVECERKVVGSENLARSVSTAVIALGTKKDALASMGNS